MGNTSSQNKGKQRKEEKKEERKEHRKEDRKEDRKEERETRKQARISLSVILAQTMSNTQTDTQQASKESATDGHSHVDCLPNHWEVFQRRQQKGTSYLEQFGEFTKLPREMKLTIFSFVDWKTLAKISGVSKEWNILANDNALV